MSKPIKRFCFEGNIKYFGSDKDVLIPDEYVEKDVELRGAWLSTVANIDIPKMKDTSLESQQELKDYLLKVIGTLKEFNMNTIIFQVRPVNDALYKSKLNPWSSVLTGVEGMDPGFDVFGFFCEEAKKNNIDVHAWINPYRAGRVDIVEAGMTKEEFIAKLAPNNFARMHPECTILTKQNKLLLDPANELVREYVSDSIVEIAENYDIKAIHIDDYFYPYEQVADPDEEAKQKEAGFEKLSDFRRNNVDLMIELIHNKLAKLDKKVEFGISPFGIYRTDSKYFNQETDEKYDEAAWEFGSNNAKGCTTNYKGLYADVYKWMEEGWIDYVVPQDYWDLDNTKLNDEGVEACVVRYADIAKWWSWAAEKTNCKLYIGQAFYRYNKEGAWANPEEIPNQLKYNQNYENILGTIFFTFRDFYREDCDSIIEGKKLLKKLWTKPAKSGY